MFSFSALVAARIVALADAQANDDRLAKASHDPQPQPAAVREP